jgi:hypothetical protein
MGKIRGVSAMTSSIQDVVSHRLRRNPVLGSGGTLPATGHECRESEIGTIVEFDQALDSSRSRGYGRYNICSPPRAALAQSAHRQSGGRQILPPTSSPT